MVKNDIDERALIEQAKIDGAAFGELYEIYVDRIYNYIYYRTADREEAEDLTSRVFFRAIQHIGRYEDKGVPFSAWLYRIARNLVANWYRDNSRRSTIPIDRVSRLSRNESPEMALERDQEQALMLASIRRLPAERQDLLILKFVDRLSNVEIGQIMGRSEGAIKSLYHRTLTSLKAEVAQQAAQDNKSTRLVSSDKRKQGHWLRLNSNKLDSQSKYGPPGSGDGNMDNRGLK
jgi:RNA polymerase sigma-70 factor (ECF subfamily)